MGKVIIQMPAGAEDKPLGAPSACKWPPVKCQDDLRSCLSQTGSKVTCFSGVGGGVCVGDGLCPEIRAVEGRVESPFPLPPRLLAQMFLKAFVTRWRSRWPPRIAYNCIYSIPGSILLRPFLLIHYLTPPHGHVLLRPVEYAGVGEGPRTSILTSCVPS